MKKYTPLIVIPLAVFFSGCTPVNTEKMPEKFSDVPVSHEPPKFTSNENEVKISQSFNDIDPTFVIGSLVDVHNGKVMALDSYLKKGSVPIVKPSTEIVYKSFIDNSMAANVDWLTFVNAKASDQKRAEVSVTKSNKVSISADSIDRKMLVDNIRNIRAEDRKNYGIIIGYIDFILSASYFSYSEAGASASGYGAKIDGKWYSKSEDSAANHQIVAVWSPLPFVLDEVRKKSDQDLTDTTQQAITTGDIEIQKLDTIKSVEAKQP